MDEMIGVPLPTSDIIVLVVVTGQEADYELPYSTLAVPWPGAAHAGSHVRMSRYETGGISESTLYHELAHYYFNFFPAWLLEGGPQFMSAYVLDRTGTAPIEERFLNETIKSCREAGIANLHELGEPWLHYRVSPVEGCFYSMGEHFLTSLHLSLGKEVMSSALTAIYSGNLPPTAKDIYLAFQRNVPAGKQEEFHDLFGQLYGGPLANVDVNVPDDHGDNRLSATPITPEISVLGVMDHPFDTDYFSFLAEGATKYDAILENDNVRGLKLSLYRPDGGAGEPLRTLFGDGGTTGTRIGWDAEASGQHYLTVESLDGAISDYSLRIIPRVFDVDDHGDTAAEATDIGVGERITGTMDNESDEDWFRFRAVAGQAYHIDGEGQTIEASSVTLFESDGKTKASVVHGGRAGRGWDRKWAAPDSNEYYLAVLSSVGHVGDYAFSVRPIAGGSDDHGDHAPTATRVQLGEIVDGVLERAFDQDWFRFRTKAGETYNIVLNHSTISFQPVTLFASDGVTQVHEYSPRGGLPTTGTFIPWVAPNNGDHFLVFQSPDADTGAYTVAVHQGGLSEDDHGDTARTATVIEVGQEAVGVLDHRADFDYFRFMAEEGQQYEILGSYGFSQDPRISLHGPDGVTDQEWNFEASGRRQDRKYIQWVAPSSGVYYVVQWSPVGGVGPYTVTVTAG